MKKNRILAIAAGLLMTCSVNFSFGQANNGVPALSGEAQQDAQTLLGMVKSDNADELKTQHKLMTKKYKKDVNTLLGLGQFFSKEGQYKEALFWANSVYDKDSKNQEAILTIGDIYYAQHNLSEAATKYEEAVMNQRTDKRAYFKLVSVYKFINPEQALQYMQTIQAMDADDPAIDREMASIYYHTNDTAQANSTYKKYFSKVKPVDDVEAAIEYAIVQFLNKDYAASNKLVNQLLPKAPKEISLNRMKFYDLVELLDFEGAEVASKKFFSSFNDTLYNFSDYKYEGKLQTELKQIDKAAAAYAKATEMAPEEKKAELLKELSRAYQKVGKYDEAADTYQKYIEKTNPDSKVESFNKGRIYYEGAGDTLVAEETRKHYIAEGDALFKKLAEGDDSYLGPYWRARINLMLDPNKPNDLVAEQYTETLKRLEGKDAGYDSNRIECLRYLAFFYLQKDDYTNSELYADKALAINPEESLCKRIKAALSQLHK